MPNRRVLAEEWFGRGASDLRAARRLFEAGEHTTTLAVLIHQAGEKYLKGFLIYHGWRLKKTHNLVELLTEAIRFDTVFERFFPFARSATVYYLDDRYPGAHPPGYPSNEIEGALTSAQQLIQAIEESMKRAEPNE